jgi:hypothetical protein
MMSVMCHRRHIQQASIMVSRGSLRWVRGCVSAVLSMVFLPVWAANFGDQVDPGASIQTVTIQMWQAWQTYFDLSMVTPSAEFVNLQLKAANAAHVAFGLSQGIADQTIVDVDNLVSSIFLMPSDSYLKYAQTYAALVPPPSASKKISPEQTKNIPIFNVSHWLALKGIVEDDVIKQATLSVHMLSQMPTHLLPLPDKYLGNLDQPSVATYKNDYGAYVTVQSLVLGIMMDALNQRIGTQDKPSAWQTEYAVATERLQPEWATKSQHMTPAELQRESIQLLSHISLQLHRQAMQTERTNLLLATILSTYENSIPKQLLMSQAYTIVKNQQQ